MKMHSFNTLKLAILFAIVVTIAFSTVAKAEVVGGQYYNPIQVALKAWYQNNNSAVFPGFYDSTGNYQWLSSPNDMTFDGENLWISNRGSGGRLMKVRPSDGRWLPIPNAPASAGPLAFDGHYIWVSNSNTVSLIRASDGGSVLSYLLPSPPKSMAWDSWDMLIVTDSYYIQATNYGGPLACQIPTASGNTGVAFDGNSAWVSNSSGTVVQYNWNCIPQTPTINLGTGAMGIVYDGMAIWTANTNHTVARIVPGSPPQFFNVAGPAQQIAFDGGYIWVSTVSPGRVQKIVASSGNPLGPIGTIVATIGPCSNPVGLTFDGASVWGSCPATNSLWKF